MQSYLSAPLETPILSELPFRKPRAIVALNDQIVQWEDIQLVTTTFNTADNYMVVLPLHGKNIAFDLNYWSSVVNLTVKIYIGFPLNADAFTTKDLDLMIVGDVDLIEVDPLNAAVRLSGRDLTSRLIDTKTTQLYPNETASMIATKFAQEHNLNPVVTQTSEIVGRYFTNFGTNAQSLLTKQCTQWDLLTFLAQQSGFVAYVRGQDLVFEPFPHDESNAYVLNYTSPKFPYGSAVYHGTELKFKRSLTLARDVIVKVIVPHNPQSGKSFVKTARAHKGNRSQGGKRQTYTFIFAGLTPEQAQRQANTLAQNITLHEVILTTTRPGDNILRKESLLKLVGTNTLYDQIFYTDNVVRTLNIHSGYTMRISAKNHAVDTQFEVGQ